MADPVNPLHEVRALLLQFERSKLKACHVRTPWLSAFFSRDPAIRARDALGQAESAASDVLAPHLGSIAELAPIGSVVAPGDTLGRLLVLERETVLIAETAGTVVAHHHAAGALVEFGQPVLALAS